MATIAKVRAETHRTIAARSSVGSPGPTERRCFVARLRFRLIPGASNWLSAHPAA